MGKKYGKSSACKNGKGGPWANDVYRITNPLKPAAPKPYTHLGCWKDTGNRAVPQIDGSDARIRGNYRARADAINKCFQVAREKHMVLFAVQHQGWCAAAKNFLGYKKYGKSNACKNGKGGPWANDVYRITNPIKPAAPKPMDPCQTNNGGCAHTCTARNGLAVCSCNKGYQLGKGGRKCIDIDECTKNNGGCSQRCTNKQGTYTCSCNNGFHLLPDGKSCTPFEIVTEGSVTYLNVNRGRCARVTQDDCTKIARSHRLPLRQIKNPNYNLFPPGCYHKTTSDVVYFNSKPSTKECTSRRVCICKTGPSDATTPPINS